MPHFAMMGLFSWILMGLLAGALARLLTPGPDRMGCVGTAALGIVGALVGGFIAAFLFAEIISVAGLYLDQEWGYAFAFAIFIVLMFFRPQGLLGRRS